MDQLKTEADLEGAVLLLVALEPRFLIILEQHGLPELRQMEPGLKSLLRIVTDQLISLQAGAAIWNRLEARLIAFAEPDVRRCPEDELMSLGLSRAKARTFHAAAEFFRDLGPQSLGGLADHEAVSKLTSIRGVGPWTADIYLLSALMRIDAWPAGDLALQVATQDLLGLPERPDPKAMIKLAETWRPVRSVAARLLWSHYRGLKGINQRII